MAAPVQIVIEDDAGRRQVVPFSGDEITLGRAREGNTVRLAERNVSRRHARFLRANGVVFLEDLGSANGTRVNGERLAARRRIRPGDLIQIGDYDIALEGAEARGEEKPAGEPAAVTPAPLAPPPLPGAPRAEPPAPAGAAVAPPPPASSAPRPPAPHSSAALPRPALRRALFLAAVAVASLLAGWAAGALTRPGGP
ncbi:MAG TPA: FHA domain-containing protein [Anaeromyxobacteraceae bacterium]|nr:FHA domain-containing protein [Anaeromyxobacteraceae bacterium]